MLRYFLIWIGVSILSIGLASASNVPPSAVEFKQSSDYSKVELSPDGKNIAYLQAKTLRVCLGRSGEIVLSKKAKCDESKKVYRTIHQLNVSDLAGLAGVKSISIPENFYISWLEWASDDRLLVAIYRPTTVGKSKVTYGGARVLSISITDTSDMVILFDNQKRVSRQNRSLTRITNMLRDDPEHVIMPASRNSDLDLWKVNVLSGDAKRIATAKPLTFYWYTDRKGNPTLRFDCRNRRCRKIDVYKNVTLLEGDSNLTSSEDIIDWKWERIKTFKTKPEDDESDFDFWPIAPAENSDQYYVLSQEDGDARRSVKIFDLAKKEYVKTVYEHPKYDIAGSLTNLQTGDYAGAWYYDDRLNYHFTDQRHARHYKALQKYFNNEMNVSLLGYSADGNNLMVYVTGPQDPGSYYVYDFNAREIELLIHRKPKLTKSLNGKSEILSIPTRDGEFITAYRNYPSNHSGASAPLIVMPHGGPEVRDYYDYDSTVQYFVTRGYQVLQLNFRGSSGYGREFAKAGYGEWGGVMHEDITDAVNYLYKNGTASPENSCILGYSYGGFAALYAGAKTPDMYRCIVSGGGLSDLLLDLKYTRRDYGKDSESYKYWVESMGNPDTDKQKLKDISPINMAELFKAPVLLIHGEYDGIVDVKHSELMLKALEKVGAQVEYLELEDEGHYNWEIETHELYLETIEDFLAKNLSLPPN